MKLRRRSLIIVSGATGLLLLLAIFLASRKNPPASVVGTAWLQDSPVVPNQGANPDLESIRTKLRAKSTPESLAELATVASSRPEVLVAQIRDDTNDLPARTRAAQILVRSVTGGNLRLLAPLLARPLPLGIKKAIVEGLAERDTRALKSELLVLVKEFKNDGKDGREVIELAIRAFVGMPDPEGGAVRLLEKGVTRARASRPRMEDLLELVSRSSSADPVLVAGALDLIFAELPETSTDEINAKNRFIAELMQNASEAAAVVLESVALGSSGRAVKSQAIHALGNTPRRRSAEILLKVIQASADLELAKEAAYVLRRVKNFSLETWLPILEAALKEGQAELSITLASSMLEASEPSRRSHEFITLALNVASKFKGTGGPRAQDLKLHLAEYGPDPVKTLRELYLEIGWRILKSSAVQSTHLPGMAELLADVFRNKETPDSQRIRVADLLGKGGAFERINEEVFALLEKTNDPRISEGLANVIRTYGRDKEKDRLESYIESLPQGSKRRRIEKER